MYGVLIRFTVQVAVCSSPTEPWFGLALFVLIWAVSGT